MIRALRRGAQPSKYQKRRTSVRRTLALGLACTLVTGVAWGYWSAGSVPGGNGQAQAATVGQGNTPSTTANGNTVTVSWAASTLTNGQAVDGYKVKRYSAATHASQTILSACDGTVTVLSCVESSVPAGDWVYTVTPVFATNWLGVESQYSAPVTSDTTAPVNDISLAMVSGGAAKTGNTVYYRGVAAGSVQLSNALVDVGSGPASSATAALGGTSTGWTHAPSMVSTPAGGPFVSNGFSWAAGTTSAPTEVVTGRDTAGNSAQTTVSFVNDSTDPTGSITYPNGYLLGTSVTLTLAANDGGSGIATRQIRRASAPLSGTTCGTFTSFANLGAVDPTSPYADTTVANGYCYKYEYVVTDLVGNQFVATNSNVAKVGATHGAPAGTSATLTAIEDTPRTLTTSDFGFSDPLEDVPDALLAVKVTTLPATGTLKLNGGSVTTGQYVSASDIGSGSLVFQAAANGNGTPYTSFTFQVQDDGGTANGGSDLDASPNTLTFNVTAVNDTPTFTKGADQTVVGDTGAYSIPNWATNRSAGPTDEVGQTLTFTVTTPTPTDLFTVAPAISSTGTLTYTLKPGATGTKTVTVKVTDNGTPAQASPDQTFTITVSQPPCTAGSSTVTASADTWNSQASPAQNKATDSALYVASGSGKAQRALVQFTLPTIPAGCTLTAATFELSQETASNGRIINVSRASSIWSAPSVMWSNQPSPVGTAVGIASNGTGWKSWSVTSIVQLHYTGTNTGFVVQDSDELVGAEKVQKFRSSEGGPATKPKLTVSWE